MFRLPKKQHRPLFGILFMLLGTISISIADAIGKWLTADYPFIQGAWLRSLIGVILIGMFAAYNGMLPQLKTSKPGWHGFRSLLTSIAIILIFYGLKNIPLAEFTAIIFATPFFIAALSSRFLEDGVSKQEWLAIVIGFIGILIVLRPTPDHFHIAHLTTLVAAACLGILFVSARHLTATESTLSLNFYLHVVNSVVCIYPAVSSWVMPSLTDAFLFFALALAGTLGIGCAIQAVHYAKPSTVSPIDYVRLIWTTLLGYYLWKEMPAPLTWVGIVIIIISGVYIVRHARRIPEVGLEKESG